MTETVWKKKENYEGPSKKLGIFVIKTIIRFFYKLLRGLHFSLCIDLSEPVHSPHMYLRGWTTAR